jgi:hypothetical protein
MRSPLSATPRGAKDPLLARLLAAATAGQHGAAILEDSVAIEVFSPVRRDYLPRHAGCRRGWTSYHLAGRQPYDGRW